MTATSLLLCQHCLLKIGGLNGHWRYYSRSPVYRRTKNGWPRLSLFDATSQVSQTGVHHSFCSDVFSSPGALAVRDHTLVSLHGFAFKLRGLARFFHISTSCFMSRPAVTDFPEASIQFCTRHIYVFARCVVPRPAVRELLRCSDDDRSWSF